VHATGREWGLLVALSLMWGTAFLATDVAVRVVSPSAVVAGRLTLGAAALALLLRCRGLAWPRGRVWRYYVALGFFGNALPFSLISWGQEAVPSGLASILVAVMPIATLAVATRVLDDEQLTARRACGFVLGFLGLIVLVGPEALRALGGEPSSFVRQGAILVAALSYAGNAILVRWAPARPLLVNTAGMLTAAAAMMLPVALLGGGLVASPVSVAAVLAIGWLGLVSTAAASIVYLALIGAAGATFFSLINYLIPLVAVVAGWVVLGERLSARALIALAIILTALAVSEGRVPRVGRE